MTNEDDLVTVLRRLDPTRDAERPVVDARAQADLRTILQTPVARPTRSSRWAWAMRLMPMVAAAAVVVILMIGGFLMSPFDFGARPSYAATPPRLVYTPPTSTTGVPGMLRKIADQVESLPPNGAGPYGQVAVQEWALSTRVDEQVTSKVVPMEWVSWSGPDGAGAERVRREMMDGKTIETTRPLTSRWRARELSTDPVLLERQLAEDHPSENGPAGRLLAVADAYRDQPVDPPLRAALLRYLADTPTLEAQGKVTDRLGREGIAVSLISDYSGLPTRYVMIIDPSTGLLLGTEQELTERAGRLNVPIPSVISYTAFHPGAWLPSPPFTS